LSLTVPLPSLPAQDALVISYETALSQAASKESSAVLIAKANHRAFEEALGVAPPPPLPDLPVFVARFKDVERWSHEGILRGATQTAVASTAWPMVPLASVGKVSYGLQKSPANRPGKHSRPYLRVANVQRSALDLAVIKYMDVPDEDMPKLRLMDGDVLLCEGNSPDLVGRGAIWRNEIPDCIHQNHVLRVRVDQSTLLPDFLLAVINSSHGQAYFRSKAKRTTNLASINSTEVAALPVPLAPLGQQAAMLKALHKGEEDAETKASEAKLLRSAAWAAFESALFDVSEQAS
jgi:type I restriction enzyme S subunit